MKRTIWRACSFALLAVSIAPLSGAQAHGWASLVHAKLSGYNEVATLSSPAGGWFGAVVHEEAGKIVYRLTYRGFETPVAQSHLHLGQRHTNGGISTFLCTNLGNGPSGTPPCPEFGGTVTGTVTAATVIGPTGQGIAAGEFDELVEAIRAGAVYVNVHTQAFPAGEIRGQVR
jgi:hypothetical protein